MIGKKVCSMNTKHLEYMLEVAKCQSISKAAKKLYLSQPSLSASIAALEEEIGVPLFQRSQSGVKLTEQGEQILEVAVEILRGVEQIQNIAKQDVQLTGQIHIAAIPAACSSFLVDLIILAQERYPQLSIVIKEERPRYVVQQVIKGEINLGITSVLMKQQQAYYKLFQEKRLVFQPLYEDRLCLFVVPQHGLAQKAYAIEEEINQYPLTCFDEDIYLPQLTGAIAETHAAADFLQHITYRFNNLNNIKKIAASGLAAAILPRRMGQQDEFIRRNLVPVDVAQNNMGFSVGILYRSGSLLSPAEKKIMELLQEIS